MDNNEQYRGPRRVDQQSHGRRLDPHAAYESDSDALSSGTGRHIPRQTRELYPEDIEQHPAERFGDEAYAQSYYEDYDAQYDAPDPQFYAEDEYEDETPSFNPNKATRESYQEIEPLDDDLVNYDEFGRKRKQKRIQEEKLVTRSRVIWGWVISIAAAIAIAFIVRAFLFEIIVVEGDSMRPTLETNEKLAVEKVSRYFGIPKRGDIIIVHYPDKEGTYVKRAIGLPGESVEVRDSIVYIDGQPLDEPYINSAEPYMDMSAVVVPADTVFVMGDNRAHSLDSRTSYIGPISHSEIVGHAMAVIWPFDNIHSVQ